MKTKMMIVTLMTLACASVMAQAADDVVCPVGDGPVREQLRVQDRLQTCTPDLEQDCTRLPSEVQEAVKDMTQARKQYQQQLREKQLEVADCTEVERDALRVQPREQLKEQVRDREQIRERLRELRECVPSHQELMEQAREATRDHVRRAD